MVLLYIIITTTLLHSGKGRESGEERKATGQERERDKMGRKGMQGITEEGSKMRRD